MSKYLSFIALPLGLLIVLQYFGLYDANTILLFDIVLVGALFLIGMQVLSFIMVHQANAGTSFMGKVIKTLLALPGILYVAGGILPFTFGIDLEIIIALVLILEGLYGLH